jgi:hypothetical protein
MSDHSKDPEYYIDAVSEQINIYNGAETFLESYSGIEQPAGMLYAAHWAQSEICNGGFRQLFKNSTGVLSPEAVQGFGLIGMLRTAELLIAAMQTLGDPYPRDRMERQTRLETVSEDTLRALDKQFFVEIENESGGFDSAVRTFVQTSE